MLQTNSLCFNSYFRMQSVYGVFFFSFNTLWFSLESFKFPLKRSWQRWQTTLAALFVGVAVARCTQAVVFDEHCACLAISVHFRAKFTSTAYWSAGVEHVKRPHWHTHTTLSASLAFWRRHEFAPTSTRWKEGRNFCDYASLLKWLRRNGHWKFNRSVLSIVIAVVTTEIACLDFFVNTTVFFLFCCM